MPSLVVATWGEVTGQDSASPQSRSRSEQLPVPHQEQVRAEESRSKVRGKVGQNSQDLE